MANLFRCATRVAPKRRNRVIYTTMTQSINGSCAPHLDLYIYLYTCPRRCTYNWLSNARGANLRSICIGVYRASASFSLSHSLGSACRQFSEMQTECCWWSAHLIVVYIISLLSLSGIVSAQRDVVFPLGRAANTINGCFSSSLAAFRTP